MIVYVWVSGCMFMQVGRLVGMSVSGCSGM